MPDIQIFGERLKKLRTNLKLSQRDFAENVGITASALSSYENGQKNPSVGVVTKIAAQYHVSLDWLCGISRESDYFMPDENIHFDLPAALLGLLRLIEEGYLQIRDDETTEDDKIVAEDAWIRTLDSCNGDLSEFLTSVMRISELHYKGALGDTSYEVCTSELISNYASIIQQKEREYSKKMQAEREKTGLLF